MGKHVPNKEYYCGHCQKKYSKKQNWEEHFETKKGKCYHTKGPRVWDHTLEQAVEKYKHAKKAEVSFKPIISAGTSTSCDAFECPPPSKKSKFSDVISTELHQSVESNEDEGDPIQKDIEEQKREKSQLAQLSADSSVDRYGITETDIKGNKEKHVPSSDSEMLAKILQLTTETHAIMTQNKKVTEKC